MIEGSISDKEGESKVKITKTLNFDETAQYPLVSGAFVTITDNTTDQTDTLSESEQGIYINNSLVGTEGHNYTLNVKIENEIFSAVSKMPFSVHFYSIVQEAPSGLNMNDKLKNLVLLTPHYIGSYNFENFYQFVIIKNDTLQSDFFVRSDVNLDGNSSASPLWIIANKADLVTIDMQCVDKTTYDYYFGLIENIYQSSSTPSNPASNINNGALGVFKAHTSQKKSIIIE